MIFKKYKDNFLLFLTHGSIFLHRGTFTVKRNYDRFDDKKKIYDVAEKMQSAQDECKELLLTLPEDLRAKLLKEVIRFGDRDDQQEIKEVFEDAED